MSEPERPRAPHVPGPLWAGLRLAAALPVPAGYWLAAGLGEVAARLDADRTRQIIDTMAVVLAQAPAHPAARRLAHASQRAAAMGQADAHRLPALPPAMVERGLLRQGWGHLDAALARGTGAIVVTATIGPWRLLAPVLARLGYRVAADGVDEASMVAALARNEVVVLVVAGPAATASVPVRMFDRPIRLAAGPARLARRSGAPLLHGWLVRRPDLLSFQGGVEPVAGPARTGDAAADDQGLTQALADRLARAIQTHADQWLVAGSTWPALAAAPVTTGAPA